MRLSLLVRDEKGAPLALRRLRQPAEAEGELELDLAAMELPEGARLFLFCEELGGEKQTNYASPLQELALQIVEPTPEPTAEPTPAPTPERPNFGLIEPVPTEKPFLSARGEREMGTAAKIVVAVLLVLLAVGLGAASLRRQSIIPLVLLILLLLLAAIVDLRAGTGFFPGL